MVGVPPQRPPLSRRAQRWLWIGTVAAVLVGIAAVGLVLLTARSGSLSRAADGSSDAVAEASAATAFSVLATTIETGDALAASTTANQLADPTAYSELMGALTTARAAQSATAAKAIAARETLAGAIDQVNRSRSAKALADAQAGLGAIIGTAVDVNAEAAGHVADDAVRVELQARIDAGRALLASTTATVDEVNAGSQTITEQTAAVLAARILGFQAAQGRWCALGALDCLGIAWPTATLADGATVELSGGEHALDGSGCFETDEFGRGRERAALLYCPAGEPVPDSWRVSGLDAGDLQQDRLWSSADGALSGLRYRG